VNHATSAQAIPFFNSLLVDGDPDAYDVVQSNRLVLAGTRSRGALVAFQDAIRTVYNSTAPDRVAIKEKPESGKMRAGAASLKMESIALANAPCDVVFVSGARVNQCGAERGAMPKYLDASLKAAVVGLS
jgi:hypothetical protein